MHRDGCAIPVVTLLVLLESYECSSIPFNLMLELLNWIYGTVNSGDCRCSDLIALNNGATEGLAYTKFIKISHNTLFQSLLEDMGVVSSRSLKNACMACIRHLSLR